jgi:uncharacterized membrane protein YbaN (DUF454 family)
VRRPLYLLAGWLAFLVGAVGVVVPLLPTIAPWILAAFFFSRSSPRLDAWLVSHPVAGPHILSWRERGAISRRGKMAATVALAASSTISVLTLSMPLALVPVGVCLLAGAWIWSRPD